MGAHRDRLDRTIGGFTLLELMLAVAIIALLAGMAVPAYDRYVQRANAAAAIRDIATFDMRIERFVSNEFRPPDTLAELGGDQPLDPWGRPYRYLRIAGNDEPGLRGRLRKDRNLVPINSDYDLYSTGPDGDTRPPLTAAPSRDDIVRAADGSFLGSAEDF